MENYHLLTHNIECNSYTGQNLDKELSDAIDDSLNSIVPWFIMATYAQDEENDPILSEAAYSRMVKRIIDNWDKIDHNHKNCIHLDVKKMTVYVTEYPPRIKGGVDQLRGAYKIGEKYRT